jgi:hypothetical protein
MFIATAYSVQYPTLRFSPAAPQDGQSRSDRITGSAASAESPRHGLRHGLACSALVAWIPEIARP